MAKKTLIKDEGPAPGLVIGLSSGEKIWKLAWEVNRVLDIRLAIGQPQTALTGDEEIYADLETPGEFDYFLRESHTQGRKAPKVAKEFRYWLFLRPRGDKTHISAEKVIRSLKAVPHIALAADLSASLQINDWIS